MKLNGYISNREHKALLIVAFLAFIFVLSVFTAQIAGDYNDLVSETQKNLNEQFGGNRNIRFSNCSPAIRMGAFHFLTFFIFVSLLKTKRFLLSSFSTLLYAFIFIYGLFVRVRYSGFDSDSFLNSSLIEQFYLVARDFDFPAAFFISTLFFWQISILLRMLIKTSQRENVLP